MKTLKFTNENKTIDVEYLVDLIGGSDMLTVYQIAQYVDGVKQLHLNGTAIAFGMFDGIDKIVSGAGAIHTPYTLQTAKALAAQYNLQLDIYESDQAVVVGNARTDLAVTTELIDAGVAGLAQIETLTIPATAAAAQGDYVVLTNALSQESIALWLDIGANGTAPTGAEYLAADFKVKVSIVGGATAAANATAFATKLALSTDWTNEVTITDNLDGTVEIAQLYNGAVQEAVLKNADDSGAGSITSVSDAVGTVGTAYEFTYGAEGGNTPYIWSTESTLPEGITLSTAGVLSGTPREVGTFAITTVVTDSLGVTADHSEDFEVTAT